MWRRLCIAAVALVLVAIFPDRAGAHATLTSSVALDIRDDAVEAELQLPLDQLGLALKLDLSDPRAVLPALEGRLRTYIPEHFGVRDADGSSFTSRVDDLAVKDVDGASYLVAHVAVPMPTGASRRWLTVHDDVILHQVVTHHILVSVRRDFEQALFGQEPKILGVLTYAQKDVVVPREGASAWRGFRAMVDLGVRHIAEGTDHLLFLLVLLLPAPLLAATGRWRSVRGLKGTFRAVLLIVTSFTVGHSISLAIGALGWVTVPSRPVEVAIALSILVTAAHAFRPLFAKREAVVGLLFGMVHGLAFATVLQELGVRRSNLALSLLGFNLGIEAMQLAVVLLFVPWLVLLSRTAWYSGFRLVGASFATIAASGWLVERVTGKANGISRAGAALMAHGLMAVALVASLSIAAMLATLVRRRARSTAAYTSSS